MAKEKFVRTKPHLYIAQTSGVDDILGGAEFSLCINSLEPRLDTLKAKRSYRGTPEWTNLNDSDPGRRLQDGVDLVATLSDPSDRNVAASFKFHGCLAVKWEINTDEKGDAVEILHFECRSSVDSPPRN